MSNEAAFGSPSTFRFDPEALRAEEDVPPTSQQMIAPTGTNSTLKMNTHVDEADEKTQS